VQCCVLCIAIKQIVLCKIYGIIVSRDTKTTFYAKTTFSGPATFLANKSPMQKEVCLKPPYAKLEPEEFPPPRRPTSTTKPRRERRRMNEYGMNRARGRIQNLGVDGLYARFKDNSRQLQTSIFNTVASRLLF
jgi:hypothetical protein